ncbi:Na+/H+ antiporter [Chitinophaga horti]|uniref:Na+/H+ antiporter n=1 Tax=Chitinophaga horti TaxID=2920382 RepID=A0ABY6J5B6_9BACT|nr:Na+/H+ antiporter [Chitinophaga horti]UYQ94868.1 Na+/H+ antiporter [Chitinophaga horti]
MLHEHLLLIILMLFVVSLLVMLGQKLRISYPIFLVLAGLGISLIPGTPHIDIDPNLIFMIFLPPLLYEAAWYTSWKEFWKWRRPIGLLAFGLVIFTSTIVAYVSHAIIPGFTLALGFLLGGIISPPDAVAATSVLKGLSIPKRVTTILEGESLVNDASSLIVFRFALAAVTSGQFILGKAVGDFFLVSLAGIAVGLIIGQIFYLLHRYLPTTPQIDTALTLMAPYLMYLTAEEFHFSGVLAVVSGGLFLSFRSHSFLSYRSRIQSANVWSTAIFLLNGLVFILIGLQLPAIVEGLEDYSMMEAIYYGLLISLLIIVIRIVWVYPATFLPRMLSRSIREKEQKPTAKSVFIVAWSGMRGVVSLASALSIPLTINPGVAFPERNVILFITFVVILVTLVFQGLSLPLIIRLLNIEGGDSGMKESEQEASINLQMAQVSLAYLEANHAEELETSPALQELRKRFTGIIENNAERLDKSIARKYRKILVELIDVRRQELNRLRHEHDYDDELLRKHESNLDLEEARLRK